MAVAAEVVIKGRNELGPAVLSAERQLKQLLRTGELVGKTLRGGAIVGAALAFEKLAENAEAAALAVGDKGTAQGLHLLNREIDNLKSKGTNLIGKVLGSFGTAAFGTGLDQKIADLQALIDRIDVQLKGGRFGRGPLDIDALKKQRAVLQGMLDDINKLQSRFATGPTVGRVRSGGGSDVLITSADVERQAKEAEEARRKRQQESLDRFEEAQRKAFAAIGAVKEHAVKDWDDALDAIAKSNEAHLDDIQAPFKQVVDEMSVFAEQAARNMQDAFAQFLFDPFQDGLKGMVRGFIDAIRVMLAQAAAFRAFSFLGAAPGGGFVPGSILGKLFGRAGGGPVSAGQPYIVGEKGPELFVPSTSGSVMANGVGGFTYNIDARGADADRIMAILPPLLKRTSDDTVARVRDLRARGRL